MDTIAQASPGIPQRSLGAAEREIDRFIERQSRKGETDPASPELEPGYMESVRLFRERPEAEMRSRWIAYEQHMTELHTRLAEEHREKAERLLEPDGDQGEGGP